MISTVCIQSCNIDDEYEMEKKGCLNFTFLYQQRRKSEKNGA